MIATAPCWAFRYEAMGYADAGEALGDLSSETLDELARLSGREAVEDADGYCWYRLDVLEDMCVEDDGHDGPHRFTPQDEIVLVFR